MLVCLLVADFHNLSITRQHTNEAIPSSLKLSSMPFSSKSPISTSFIMSTDSWPDQGLHRRRSEVLQPLAVEPQFTLTRQSLPLLSCSKSPTRSSTLQPRIKSPIPSLHPNGHFQLVERILHHKVCISLIYPLHEKVCIWCQRICEEQEFHPCQSLQAAQPEELCLHRFDTTCSHAWIWNSGAAC